MAVCIFDEEAVLDVALSLRWVNATSASTVGNRGGFVKPFASRRYCQPKILPAKKIALQFDNGAKAIVFKAFQRAVRLGGVALRIHIWAASQ